MSDKAARLSALKQAQWRVKHAGQRCRICGGSTIHSRPYCSMHWSRLRGGSVYSRELMVAAAKGERLDEADEVIRFRDTFGRMQIGSGGRMLIGPWQIYRPNMPVGSSWRIVAAEDPSTVLAEVGTVDDVIAWIRRKSEAFHLRNRYAVKRLIL